MWANTSLALMYQRLYNPAPYLRSERVGMLDKRPLRELREAAPREEVAVGSEIARTVGGDHDRLAGRREDLEVWIESGK